MNDQARTILNRLDAVEAIRAERRGDPMLDRRVTAIKQFQHARFERCYQDLLSTAKYSRAARFFLDDLYGPRDFADRDAQFARVVPALVRLFPESVVGTVLLLSELHALSEDLDSQMAMRLPGSAINAGTYTAAWRAVGRREHRLHQIALTLQIGQALRRFTSTLVLRQTLRMMRVPARAAGLSALQTFLENGFDAFRSMGADAQDFLDTIGDRERGLALMLFDTAGVDHVLRPLVAYPWPAPVNC